MDAWSIPKGTCDRTSIGGQPSEQLPRDRSICAWYRNKHQIIGYWRSLVPKRRYVDPYPQRLCWLAPWRADKTLARSAEGIGGMCYADATHPTDEAIECYFGPLVSSPHRKALVHAYVMALERNVLEGIEPALRRCEVPTRIVWGAADAIFSAESPDYLDRTFGASRGVRRLAGRKLFWPEELPDVIAEEARQLWGVTQALPASAGA